jgi:hypothetical protein
MSHTPGPWSFDGDYVESLALLKPLSVATLADCGHSTEGNGILIAAAPELLAALKDAYDALDYAQAQVDSDDVRWHLTRCCRKIKPVIDKAEGRSE